MLSNKDVLQAVVDEIMTDMFFMFQDLDDDGMPVVDGTPGEGAIQSQIHFFSDFCFNFVFDPAILVEMASNFMGLTPDMIEEEHLNSMASETANIIGGNYLVKIDPDHNFKLSIPEIINDVNHDGAGQEWSTAFVTEGRVMKIFPSKRDG